MHTILQTIDNASQVFAFGYVAIDKEKIARFRLDGAEDLSACFFPFPCLGTLLDELVRERTRKIIHIFNAINAALQYSQIPK